METHPSSSKAVFTPALARILATVSVAFVVTQLDVTIVNIALANIASDLGTAVSGLQWIVDAYTLAFAVLMLSGGVLGDKLGARRVFAAGIAVFAVASLGCALATNATTLVVSRALQGAGAAAMLPNSLSLLNAACAHDAKLRARAVGLWTATGAVSIAAGPVIGGLLIAAFGWRSVFFVNLPICVAGLFATFAFIEREPAANASRGIDLPGQLLAIVTLTAFTGAVIEYRPLGLGHPLVYGGFALALVAALAFVAVESRVRSPMVPLKLFRIGTFSAAVVFGICVNLTYYGMVFVLSLFLQRVRGYSPLMAGLAFLPLTGGFLISNVASGSVIGRYGVRAPMIVGAAIAALGYGLLLPVSASTSLAGMLAAFLMIPSGMGLAVPAMTTAILASVDKQRAGTASAVLNTARQAGGTVGVAAFGALVSGSTAQHLVSGMHIATAVCVALLVIAAVLGCLVHPQPHTEANANARRAAARAPNQA